MAVDRSRLAAALAYRQAEEERRRRMMESVPVPGAELPTPAPSQNLRRDLENLSIGIGEGLTNQLEGVKGIVTDPIGAAKGAYEGVKAVVRDPSIIADALRYTAQKVGSGPLGAGEVIGEMIGPRKTGPTMAELDVYHGTPHRFPATEANPLGEFDASKIGTGHGAQAYGEGIYYSESPEFAGSFAPMNKSSASVRASFIRLRDQAPKNSAEWKHYDDLAKEGFGSVYKADLPDEMVEKMLDYNKAIKDQTKYVKAALSEIGIDTELDKPASVIAHGMEKRLLEVGIPGLIYREKGGPRNFVVFPGEEKKVRILERK